ncbi:Gfo/Idh/MocA family protein [Capillimicrobium parvum]|uniref:Oxidoreductase YdgJ n=1 Tax=Capillimicrobium parvum TaxID=2884022 RepID=A0A9E7C0W1_9ACTN|nr:Gfo/Idh/MocA family oxidoreductase [Capillimicrobium parvum]UGS36840.1 putative oxidoreductase YdgJ [Capillimicrobium parvum]
MRPVRVALIGYGLAGASFHAPFIATTEGLELAAIVTRDPGRRAAATGRYPGVELLDGAEEVFARAADFGLVVVAAPNRAHVTLATAALEAGLDVVVDKPLAPTAAEGRALVKLAGERGRMLTVFHNRRWDGDLLTVRRLIEAGDLGRVLRFESRFERFRPQLTEGWRERADPEDAGGVLYDLGPHLIDQALLLFGPAVHVYGEVDVRRTGARVDDDAFVAMTHASGVRSHLWMSAVTAQVGPRLRVLGDRAGYVKHGLDVQEAALRDGGDPGGTGWGREDEAAWGVLGTDGNQRRVETEPGDYGAFYRGVAAALCDGAPPPVDPADTVAGLEAIEAARRSNAEGVVVSRTGRRGIR